MLRINALILFALLLTSSCTVYDEDTLYKEEIVKEMHIDTIHSNYLLIYESSNWDVVDYGEYLQTKKGDTLRFENRKDWPYRSWEKVK